MQSTISAEGLGQAERKLTFEADNVQTRTDAAHPATMCTEVAHAQEHDAPDTEQDDSPKAMERKLSSPSQKE